MYIGLVNGERNAKRPVLMDADMAAAPTKLATVNALEDAEALLGIGIEGGKALAGGDPFSEKLWRNRAQLVLDQIAAALRAEGFEDYPTRRAEEILSSKIA